ncbi:hypothetical protein DL764_005472 [Monosporascus ibericus]|uniref:Peptidase M20 domain-containing protein 2 n=1 Tax=Monosporascus ibericus TaxID=155417 RepID=A0A4Q4T8W5_9PEZI|nr:hypothetical protein DL764_005472 [Monosporascus ibericus]
MGGIADGFVVVNHDEANSAIKDAPPNLSDISATVDGLAADLWPVNKMIHDNPEFGFQEIIAHHTLTLFMRSKSGWKVFPSAYGMATAWVAEFDTRRKWPVVFFNVEMGGGGKIKLLQAGAYKDHNVDISLMSHPGIVNDCALMRTAAYTAFTMEYFGREAHAAANPWQGINALDALITAYNALSVLRQQTMPGDVIQGSITNGGVCPNITHAYAAGNFVVRADTQARLEELKKKVDACFQAGATATGGSLKMTTTQSYADHVPNRVLGDAYRRYFNLLSPPHLIPENDDIDEIRGRTTASTDQGNVSYAMPSLHAGFSIPPGSGGNGPHNPEFAEAAGTKVAFERSLRVAKAPTGVAVDVPSQNGLLEKVKNEWKREIQQSPKNDPARPPH